MFEDNGSVTRGLCRAGVAVAPAMLFALGGAGRRLPGCPWDTLLRGVGHVPGPWRTWGGFSHQQLLSLPGRLSARIFLVCITRGLAFLRSKALLQVVAVPFPKAG